MHKPKSDDSLLATVAGFVWKPATFLRTVTDWTSPLPIRGATTDIESRRAALYLSLRNVSRVAWSRLPLRLC